MSNPLAEYLNSGSINVSGFLLTNLATLKINAAELTILLELQYFRSQGERFPAAPKLAKVTGFSEDNVYEILHQLVSKKLIVITTSTDGKDEYSFAPLVAKLNELLGQEKTQSANMTDKTSISNQKTESISDREQTFKMINHEFGRMLSPIELEMIKDWFEKDHYSAELVQLALREAVLNQVYNLKYMDRILLNWKKHNVQSAAQVEVQREQRQQQTSKGSRQPLPKVPLFKIKKDQGQA
ncbi:DnaD domain-containing protein [Fructilactobacillus carniphilus]|uniref:DnaD domain protein n=1 Tax=Fructilactobacillus carniphilus TaxID=2940297 RepID=A0ABY5BY09_9LACO|nr:DnaD domain protein [Fructilactobacillus carniphilus]USS91106.1 DnaD domain protein [Fructilactobacillus carniphilus]